MTCSDGSVSNNQGSFGWVMSPRNGVRLVKCSGPAHGCDLGDSFRAEAYGVLSWMMFFTEYSKHQNVRLPTSEEINKLRLPCIQAHADNEGVMTRIATQLSWKCLSPGCTLAPDWGAINQMCEVMKLSLPSTAMEHIKGHQDSKVPKYKLPLPAQLNVEADESAGDCQKNNKDHDRSMVLRLPANCAQLHAKDTTVTSKHPSKLRFQMTFPKIQECLIQRNNWSLELFNSIDWDSHRMAITKTTLPRQFVNSIFRSF